MVSSGVATRATKPNSDERTTILTRVVQDQTPGCDELHNSNPMVAAANSPMKINSALCAEAVIVPFLSMADDESHTAANATSASAIGIIVSSAEGEHCSCESQL